jgi:PhoPQ-activated pathogenicity-related protein
MRFPTTPRVRFVLLASAALSFGASVVRADLQDYVKKPEPKFEWKLREKQTVNPGTIYDLQVTSQVWHDITWTHQVQVYQPKDVAPTAVMFVYNTGGKANAGNVAFGMELAQKMKAPVAFVYDIPNQPLLDGKKEDALIAETFVRYLETKDGDWPLLFPMVKGVVKSMDALQAFAKEEWKAPIKGFIISGASKRGWTTWLTAAADERIVAFAPLVIDTLNMVEQMDYQKKSFGAYSEQIRDYTERGLVPIPPGEEPKKLWQMIDPYFYREKLKQPKMLINGNNDPYWTTDALNLYWDGLKGNKYVVYVPNAGHNLAQGATKDKPGDRSRTINALAAFARHQITGKEMPKLEWTHDDNDGKLRLKVEATPAPSGARLWVATAPTRDFRKATWTGINVPVAKSTVVGEVEPPLSGCLAYYAELDYEIDGIRYHLSTQIRIAGTPKPQEK